MATLLLLAHYVASKAGKTGLTVTLDLHRIALANGTSAEVVTAGACSEVGDGVYSYRYTDADLATYQYVGVFKTTDTSVDQQHIPVLGLVVPDVLVSSRAAPADIPTPPDTTAIADAVWDEDVADHIDEEQKAGYILKQASTNTPDTAAAAVWQAELTGFQQAGWAGKKLYDLPTAAQVAVATADAVWDEPASTHVASHSTGELLAAAAVGGGGAGAEATTITVDDGANALDGVEVWITSDAAGVNVVASGQTDANGEVTLMLDPGSYYVWCQRAGTNFTNPTALTVSTNL